MQHEQGKKLQDRFGDQRGATGASCAASDLLDIGKLDTWQGVERAGEEKASTPFPRVSEGELDGRLQCVPNRAGTREAGSSGDVLHINVHVQVQGQVFGGLARLHRHACLYICTTASC